MTVSTRKGSALLVVLGMLAFMVVSAVAFSAYMRYSRLPSSFLRRTVSSRLLVKAALAEAIDEIDASIGNNPHPGFGTQQYRYPRYNGRQANRNKWIGRVYIGGTNMTDNVYDEMVDFEDTISTLCTEGLAYIPPPIVNEARYYSRRSNAAVWKSMEFDAGRYAYCALDVSDYFDVNQIYADVPRSSSAMGRVSLAYLFENEQHTSSSGELGTPKNWDDFMKNYRNDWIQHLQGVRSTKIPLVSLADWNLALWDKKPGSWQSPFCNFVENNGANFYGIGDPDGPEADKIRRMCFVTDGLFPAGDTSDPDADYDLNDPRYQPFEKSFLDNKNKTLANFVNMDFASQSKDRLMESICALGFASLCDYLDEDNVPVSLAIPTTERVPMVCGLQPKMTAKLAISQNGADVFMPETDTANAASPATREKTLTRKYNLSGLAELKQAYLTALLVYPFRHNDGVNKKFKVDGRVSLFLTSEDMGLRADALTERLRIKNAADLSNDTPADGVIPIPIEFADVIDTKAIGDVKEENETIKRITAMCNRANAGDIPFLEVTYKWTQQRVRIGEDSYAYQPAQPDKDAEISAAQCFFCPLKSTGAIDDKYQKPEGVIAAVNAGAKLKLNAAFQVRVYDESNPSKTVDLVPASLADDALNIGGLADTLFVGLRSRLGSHALLRMDAGGYIDLAPLAPGTLTPPTADPVNIDGQSLMVFDPRHNHAPESWFQSATDLSAENWLQRCHAHDVNRDGDIFMMVSDQGYLQSIYELANLPRLTDFYKGTKYDFQGSYLCPSAAYNELVIPTDENKVANLNLMWKTYNPFPNRTGYEVNGPINGRGTLDGDDFAGAGFTSAGNGPKINPYSDCTNVIMAAFANTPHDWRCASTNDPVMVFEEMTAKEFNQNYAWNQYSSGAKMNWEDLEYFAACFMDSVKFHAQEHAGNRSKSEDGGDGLAESIEEAWRHLASNGSEFQEGGTGWFVQGQDSATAQKQLCGLDLAGDKLYNCDKKFLYGYWHDCFAAKQQLFLVFVRAEPAMMGSGSVNQIPPQLGARAVALVWRDPRMTQQDNDPHKTRILFYRQFD